METDDTELRERYTCFNCGGEWNDDHEWTSHECVTPSLADRWGAIKALNTLVAHIDTLNRYDIAVVGKELEYTGRQYGELRGETFRLLRELVIHLVPEGTERGK